MDINDQEQTINQNLVSNLPATFLLNLYFVTIDCMNIEVFSSYSASTKLGIFILI